jgi:hypothetical protein
VRMHLSKAIIMSKEDLCAVARRLKMKVEEVEF